MDMSLSTPGVGDGQGSLVCCSPWGRKESDMTERLNWTDLNINKAASPACVLGYGIFFLSFQVWIGCLLKAGTNKDL